MNSRETILAAISKNKPGAFPLPERFAVERNSTGLVAKYVAALQSVGGRARCVESWHEVVFHLQQQIMSGAEVVNGIEELVPYNIERFREKKAAELEAVHNVFLKGQLAVAENGAVWLPEINMVNRLLPFLCQELVLVIHEKDIVADMHQACEQIWMAGEDYGVFIAGPSKTADIEQALVIGAHGPLRLQVLVIKDQ